MLLPLGVDEHGKRRLPHATLLLLLLNAGAYAFCVIVGWIAEGPSLERTAALSDNVLANVAMYPSHPALSTFVASPWIHLDILHLAGNLLFLWVFGVAAEEALGGRTVFWIYLACGLGSAAVQYMAAGAGAAPADIGYVGSSGAVIGLILAFAVRRYRAKVRIWLVGVELKVPVPVALGVFFLWYGVAPAFIGDGGGGSGYWGHLGGAVTGLMLALALRLGARGVAEYSLEDALAFIARGQLENGLQELRELQRLMPDDARIPLALARAHLKVWDKPEALGHFGVAIQKELSAGRLEGALAIWNEAVAAKVALPPGQTMRLAAAAAASGQTSLSIRLYRQVASSADEAAAHVARKRLEEMRK